MRAGETPKPVGGDTFLAYVYRIRSDKFEWCEYTRESLLQEIAHIALGQHFLGGRDRYVPVRAVRRAALRAHLVDVMSSPSLKLAARMIVLNAWAEWWRDHWKSVKLARRIGHEHARELRGDTLRDMLSAVGATILQHPA